MSTPLDSNARARLKAAAKPVLVECKASGMMHDLLGAAIDSATDLEAAQTKARKTALIFLGADWAIRLECALAKALE